MTANEIQILISGIAIGAEFMVGLNVFWSWRDDRRDRKALTAAEAKLNAARENQ